MPLFFRIFYDAHDDVDVDDIIIIYVFTLVVRLESAMEDDVGLDLIRSEIACNVFFKPRNPFFCNNSRATCSAYSCLYNITNIYNVNK